MFLKINEKEIISWIKNYLKINSIFHIYIKTGMYSGVFIVGKKTINEFKEITGIRDFDIDTNFIQKNFPYDKTIIQKSNLYKISNLDLINLIIKLEDMNFKINSKIISKIDFQGYLLTIFKNNEKIIEFRNKKNEVSKEIYKLLKKEIIMSSEKENYIIKEVSKECSKYDLDLKNYQYRIVEINDNVYEVELENKITESIILIKNIKLNKDNIIINIGENKGFVL